MRQITRYLLIQLCIVSAVLGLALAMAIWLAQSLRFLDFIVNRGLPASSFLEFVILLLPSFLVTELTEAFQIGFLVLLPFLVVDLVVSNVLMSLGMHMMNPTQVSMPFKLLLFVLVDGWYLLARALVVGYA